MVCCLMVFEMTIFYGILGKEFENNFLIFSKGLKILISWRIIKNVNLLQVSRETKTECLSQETSL